MAFLKFKVKDMIVMSLCTALISLPYFILMHTPTLILVQNALASRLNNFMGNSTERDGEDWISKIDVVKEEIPPIGWVNITAIEAEFPGLREILRDTALPNKTLLLTALNSAWAEEDSMIDLFLGSFHSGEKISHYLDHLLIICLDQASYDRCKNIHHRCFRLETEGVDFAAEKYFMSDDYLKMMWRRVQFLRIVLELGYDLLFSDADIMWFRDPFPHFSEEADFQIACDHFNGNPHDINNLPNGGFVYVRSSERTVGFYQYWYESRLKHPKQHDQDVFNYIKGTKQFAGYNLKIEFLQTKYFGGFCEVSQDFAQVCTMHANCCTGLERKIFDLKLTVSDWSQYKALTPDQKRDQRIIWQAPKECLHSWTSDRKRFIRWGRRIVGGLGDKHSPECARSWQEPAVKDRRRLLRNLRRRRVIIDLDSGTGVSESENPEESLKLLKQRDCLLLQSRPSTDVKKSHGKDHLNCKLSNHWMEMRRTIPAKNER